MIGWPNNCFGNTPDMPGFGDLSNIPPNSMGVAPDTISHLGYYTGAGPSTGATFAVAGGVFANPSGVITLTPTANIQVSADSGGTWSSSPVNVPYHGYFIDTGPILMVRLKAGLSANLYNAETVTISGGGATPVVLTCIDFVVVTTSALLTTWYAALLGAKPSAWLMYNLNIMADGMNTDSNWTITDFLIQIAGMETDEQRLKPLITNAAGNALAVASPTLSAAGLMGNGTSSYVNTQWRPSVEGINYTQNNCSDILVFRLSDTDTNSRIQLGSSGAANANAVTISKNSGACALRSNASVAANTAAMTTEESAYVAVKRTSNTQFVAINDTTTTTRSSTTSGRSSQPVYLDAYNANGTATSFSTALIKAVAFGSGNIDHTKMRTRLLAFLTAMGV